MTTTTASSTSWRWLAAVQAASLAVVVAAGRAAAGRASVHGQSAWLTVAVLSVTLASAANGLWLLRLRRATAARRRALVARFDGWPDHHLAPAAPVLEAELVALPGLTLLHRPGCPLVAGKKAQPAAAADREPCGWCRP